MSVQLTILPNLQELIDKGTLSITDITPAYGNTSAGLDLYNAGPEIQLAPITYSPTNTPANVLNKCLIPTGIKVNIPERHVGFIMERGSVVKTFLSRRAGVIDHGYTGEVFINAVNLSTQMQTIPAGAKTSFQLVVLPVDNLFQIVTNQEYEELTKTSLRSDGKIGSSDK